MLFSLFLEGDNSNGSPLGPILIGIMFVAIIGLFIWQSISGKKKQKEAQERVNKLKKGDRVKTIGGVCGFVYEINDAENTFVLETGAEDAKSYVKFDKAAIYQTAPAEGYANAPANPEPEIKEEIKTEAKEEAKPVEDVADAPALEKTAEDTVEEKTEETADKE